MSRVNNSEILAALKSDRDNFIIEEYKSAAEAGSKVGIIKCYVQVGDKKVTSFKIEKIRTPYNMQSSVERKKNMENDAQEENKVNITFTKNNLDPVTAELCELMTEIASQKLRALIKARENEDVAETKFFSGYSIRYGKAKKFALRSVPLFKITIKTKKESNFMDCNIIDQTKTMRVNGRIKTEELKFNGQPLSLENIHEVFKSGTEISGDVSFGFASHHAIGISMNYRMFRVYVTPGDGSGGYEEQDDEYCSDAVEAIPMTEPVATTTTTTSQQPITIDDDDDF